MARSSLFKEKYLAAKRIVDAYERYVRCNCLIEKITLSHINNQEKVDKIIFLSNKNTRDVVYLEAVRLTEGVKLVVENGKEIISYQ